MQIRRSLLSISLYKSHISPPSLLFFSSFSRRELVPVADYLLHRHQFSPETVAKLSSSPVKYLKSPENFDSILSFLKESGFSRSHLEKVVVRHPKIFSAKLETTIKPKIYVFQNLGFSPTDIVEIFSANPWIFGCSADNQIRPSVLALKNVLGSALDLSRLLKTSSGWFFRINLEESMIPNIEFLKSCGVSSSDIVKIVHLFPKFLLTKPEKMKEFAKRVDEMGVDRNTKMYLYAVQVVSAMSSEYWEHKWELYRSLGFSDDEIRLLFKKMPPVFGVSDSKIKETLQILRGTGKFDNSLIITYPVLLLYSVENRIKPRIRLLKVLESKGLLPEQPRVSTFCAMPNKKFLDKYVLPYSKKIGKYSIPFRV